MRKKGPGSWVLGPEGEKEADGHGMTLQRIARGRWDVLVPVESEGSSPVLDFLANPGAGLRKAGDLLSVFLRVYLPLEGLPNGPVPSFKTLGEGFFELRRQPDGSAVRVALFNDGERIVCTNALARRDGRESVGLRLAQISRSRYFDAKSRQRLEIVESFERADSNTAVYRFTCPGMPIHHILSAS